MKTNFYNSLVSVFAAGAFLLMAVGSLDMMDMGEAQPQKQSDHVADDPEAKEPYYKETITGQSFQGGTYEIIRKGPRDEQGRWHGEVTTTYTYSPSMEKDYESVPYVHGLRHGKFNKFFSGSGTHVIMCFNMGVMVACPPDVEKAAGPATAFQILNEKYKWFVYGFNAFEIDNELLEEFTQALEREIEKYDFEEEAFDQYYDLAIDTLTKDEVFKSVNNYKNILGMDECADRIRGNEIRLAVLDHHRIDGSSTFDILKTTYPGYLKLLNQAGASNTAVEAFCEELDTRMMLKGTLDQKNPFFADSVDTRLAGVLFEMMFEAKSYHDLKSIGGQLWQSGKSNPMGFLFSKARAVFEKDEEEMSPQDISFIVMYSLMLEALKGDLVRQACRDAYFFGQPRLATVTTSAAELNHDSKVQLTGHVIDDGGATVTERGIAWGSIYNPTMENNLMASGSGSGIFNVMLSGLTEGQQYFARAYAINSVGVSYGNVVSFTGKADDQTGILAEEESLLHFSVFPVPARGRLIIRFEMAGMGAAVISLYGVNGRLVNRQEIRTAGMQEVGIDIEGLPPGIYFVRLDENGQALTRKIVIW